MALSTGTVPAPSGAVSSRGRGASTPLWLFGLLVLPVVFSVWTGSLILSSRRLQREVGEDATSVRRLAAVERSIHNLDAAAPENGKPAELRSSWQHLHDGYIRARSAFPADH